MLKVAAMVLGIMGSIATFIFAPLACGVLSDQSSIFLSTFWLYAILLFWALSIIALIGATLMNSNPRVGRHLLCIAAIPCALGTFGALLSLSFLALMLFGLCALLLGLSTVFAFIHYWQFEGGPEENPRLERVTDSREVQPEDAVTRNNKNGFTQKVRQLGHTTRSQELPSP